MGKPIFTMGINREFSSGVDTICIHANFDQILEVFKEQNQRLEFYALPLNIIMTPIIPKFMGRAQRITVHPHPSVLMLILYMIV